METRTPITYRTAARDLIKSFEQPHKLVLFLSQVSYLMTWFLLETRHETKITDDDFANNHFNVIELLNKVAVPWIENAESPEAAEAKISKGLEEIVGFCGVADLQEFVTLISLSYDFAQDKGEYNAYTNIQAFNNLIYSLRSMEQATI